MSNTYVLGKTIDDFNTPNDTYLFALRRNDDGDLYLLKTELRDSSKSELFGENIENIPAQFQTMEYPSDDYFDGRNANHTLQFTQDQVKYEQWKWVDRRQSYYIDANGFFTVCIGEDKELPYIEDIKIPVGHTQTFYLNGENYDVNLYDTLLGMGWNGVSSVVVHNNGNIRSSTVHNAALTLDNRAFINGVTIINNGSIIGYNGNLQYNPLNDRNLGLAISIETDIAEFTNVGTIKAGSFNNVFANAFRGFSHVDIFTNTGTWIGYDD